MRCTTTASMLQTCGKVDLEHIRPALSDQSAVMRANTRTEVVASTCLSTDQRIAHEGWQPRVHDVGDVFMRTFARREAAVVSPGGPRA